jgi:hypothetical protein
MEQEENIVYPFDSIEFQETWNLWLKYRKEIKKTIKGKISKQAQLMKLGRLANGNEEAAIAVIMQSIENNWQGLFAVKNKSNGTTTRTTEKSVEITKSEFDKFWANAT